MSAGILVWLLILINVSIVVWGFLDYRRLYRFPVFAAAVLSGFAVPQLIGLSNEAGLGFRHFLPEHALDMTVVMCILCIAALWLGDHLGVTRPGTSAVRPLSEYSTNRILQFGFALMLVGNLVFQVSLSYISKEEIESLGSQWTGAITIVMFFANMSKYGFCIMTYMYFRTKSLGALLCMVAGLVLTGMVIILSSRRGDAANTFFVLVLGLFMARRVMVPPWLLGLLFVVGTIWANGVGQLRGTDDRFIERLERADLVENLRNILENGGPELTNCAMHIWCAENCEEGGFDFGATHWNQLVHAYFPGQIFGYELKYQLRLPEYNWPKIMRNYEGPPGATDTGMADAFKSFWWFGCLKFYAIGYFMGRWYNRAMRGDLWSQLAYMSLMSAALHTITHHTTWLLINYIHMLIFAWPGLAWAHTSGKARLGTLSPR